MALYDYSITCILSILFLVTMIWRVRNSIFLMSQPTLLGFFLEYGKNYCMFNGKICSIELIFRKAAVKRSLISKYREEGSLSNGSFVLSSILFIASLSLLRSENRKTSFEQDVQYLTVSSTLSRLYVWIFYCISLHLIWFNLIWFYLIPIYGCLLLGYYKF